MAVVECPREAGLSRIPCPGLWWLAHGWKWPSPARGLTQLRPAQLRPWHCLPEGERPLHAGTSLPSVLTCLCFLATCSGTWAFLEEVAAELEQGGPWPGEGELGPQGSRETWPEGGRLAPQFYQLAAPPACHSSQQCLGPLPAPVSHGSGFTAGTCAPRLPPAVPGGAWPHPVSAHPSQLPNMRVPNHSPSPASPAPVNTSELPLGSARWVPLGGRQGQDGAAHITTEGAGPSCCPSTSGEGQGFRPPAGISAPGLPGVAW